MIIITNVFDFIVCMDKKVHLHVKGTFTRKSQNKTGKTYPLEINVRENQRCNQEWTI